jgi:hypothetical protein
MKLDVRLPIGLMFTTFGLVLSLYGLMSNSEIYQRSLGINVNLWWGLVMLVFGLVMLWFSRRGTSTDTGSPSNNQASRRPPR